MPVNLPISVPTYGTISYSPIGSITVNIGTLGQDIPDIVIDSNNITYGGTSVTIPSEVSVPFKLEDFILKPNASTYVDKIIKDIDKHIDVQFEQGRLNGVDYGELYTQLIQFSIQAGLQWGIEAKKAEVDIYAQKSQISIEKSKFELLKADSLLDSEIKKISIDLDVKKANAELRKINQSLKLDAAKFELNKQTTNAELKKINLESEISIAKLTLAENDQKLSVQKTNFDIEATNRELAIKEARLVLEQQRNAIELQKIQKELLIADKELEIRTAQLDIEREKLEQAKNQKYLVRAKAITEIAQTSDLIPNFYHSINGVVVDLPFAQKVALGGIQGRQRDLINSQKEGFDKKTKLDFAKMMVDFYTTRYATEGTLNLSYTGLAEQNIGKILQKAALNQDFVANDIDITTSIP